jgi:predicted nucleic acid-binding protein
MTGADFIDTNVLVYAYDAGDPAKQKVARNLVRKAVSGQVMASTQVLAEFAATMRRLTPPRRPQELCAMLDALGPMPVVVPDAGVVRRAVEATDRYGVTFWDGMIVAAAERGGCTRLLSEDFTAGQRYFGVTAVNPFRAA